MRVLITGGAGFIGANAAARIIEDGHEVAIVDNLSRALTDKNLDWLRGRAASPFAFHRADVRDAAAMQEVLHREKPDLLLHLAAQVAVTTSVTDPRHDFE